MATKKTGAPGKSAPLDPKVADKLLNLLSTNNDFRRLFKKDPRAALIKAGYKPTVDEDERVRKGPPFPPPGPPPWMCCQVSRIAPKASIIKARAELKASLTAGLGYHPHRLDLGYKPSKPTRSLRK